MSDAENRLRADARVNRDRILEVAREALTSHSDASLNSIAKAAGVGAGTLYRHFPSREALLAAVYRKEIEALAALAPALLERHPPFEAMSLWFERFAEAGSVKHGIAGTLHAAVSDEDVQDTFRTLAGGIRQLMGACEGAVEIYQGVSPEDVLVLLSSVLKIAQTDEGKGQISRIIRFIIQGLAMPDAERLGLRDGA